MLARTQRLEGHSTRSNLIGIGLQKCHPARCSNLRNDDEFPVVENLVDISFKREEIGWDVDIRKRIISIHPHAIPVIPFHLLFWHYMCLFRGWAKLVTPQRRLPSDIEGEMCDQEL